MRCFHLCPEPASAPLPTPWPAPVTASSGQAVAVEYAARTNTTAAGDPGAGKVVWSTAAQGNATTIYFSNITAGGADVSHLWQGVEAGRQLTIQRKSDASVAAHYTINAVVDHGTWSEMTVTPGTNSGLPFANNVELVVGVSAKPIA